MLDWAVWALRRYCTRDPRPAQVRIQHAAIPPRVRIPGGYLEKIIDDRKHPAREALLWHNAFFGRVKGKVRMMSGFMATNSPLTLNPHILDEVLKYFLLPDEVQKAYRQLQSQPKS